MREWLRPPTSACGSIQKRDELIARGFTKGLFIEALPRTHERLSRNITKINSRCGTSYETACVLLSDHPNQEHSFKVLCDSDKGAVTSDSSSLFEPNYLVEEHWSRFKPAANGNIVIDRVNLVSNTASNLLRERGLNKSDIYLVLDTQGSELQVLKGFGHLIHRVQSMKVEASTTEYYKGQTLWSELDQWLRCHGFKLVGRKPPSTGFHGDLTYSR